MRRGTKNVLPLPPKCSAPKAFWVIAPITNTERVRSKCVWISQIPDEKQDVILNLLLEENVRFVPIADIQWGAIARKEAQMLGTARSARRLGLFFLRLVRW